LWRFRNIRVAGSFAVHMRLFIASLVAAGALAAAPAAIAADQQGTVSPSSPSFAWDGGPGTSLGANVPGLGGASVGNFVGCFDTIADCEEILIKVDAPGTLTLTTDSADDANDTIDMYLYPSDASGEYDDSEEDLAAGGGAGTTGDEKIVAKVKAGYYMVQIKFFLAQDDTYKGSAVLSGFPAPAAPAPVVAAPQAPAETPQPAAQQPAQPAQQQQSAPPAKKPSKRAACQKKAKKIKNKAKRAKALKKCKKVKG
jgi:hypothetical protein